MTKNPIVNAVLASVYIVSLVLLMSTFVDQPNEGSNQMVLLLPMLMLSLFVLSASVMGFLFLYQPFVLWFDGKRGEAVTFFLTTVATFAALTAVLFGAVTYYFLP